MYLDDLIMHLQYIKTNLVKKKKIAAVLASGFGHIQLAEKQP